jgi:hypothetical protein
MIWLLLALAVVLTPLLIFAIAAYHDHGLYYDEWGER